jgi:hypothetical protein
VKKTILAAALVSLMAVAAEAQVTLTYSKQNKNSSLTITVSGGSYSGYGYGYGYGLGYGYGCGPVAPYGPGLVANVGGGTLTFGTRHVLPYGYGWGGYGGYGMYGGGSYGYEPGIYTYGLPRAVPDYSPAPLLRTSGASDRVHEHRAAKEIEEGRRRFRWGDYRGALDEFRSAVATDPDSPLAHLYFAAALAVAGDAKNADKALRAGLDRGAAPKASLEFRDEKERQRVAGKLAADAGLAAAYALSLAGEPERLKKFAEKDPVAKKLLP